MVKTLLLLASQLVTHLLSSAQLLSVHFSSLLLLGFLLLLLDERLDHGCLRRMLMILIMMKLLLLHFFFFGVRNVLSNLFIVGGSVECDLLLLLFLLSAMQESDLGLLVQFHLQSHLLLSGRLHVTSSLIDNITSLLARLLNLLESSRLLLLEQANTVRQQAQVVFGTLPRDLGRNKLLMQCSIIVLFVRREVHLGILLSGVND